VSAARIYAYTGNDPLDRSDPSGLIGYSPFGPGHPRDPDALILMLSKARK